MHFEKRCLIYEFFDITREHLIMAKYHEWVERRQTEIMDTEDERQSNFHMAVSKEVDEELKETSKRHNATMEKVVD